MLLSNRKKNSLKSGYFYRQIEVNGLQKAGKVYQMLYSAIRQYQSNLCIVWEEADEELIPRFLFLLLADHPELFYISAERAFYQYGKGFAKIRLVYGYSEQECRKIEQEIKKQVRQLALAAKMFGGNNRVQQLWYLYRYFVTHISYAGEQLESKNERELCRIHSAVGALLDRSAVCDGISRAFKLVLDELGIENRLIRRTVREKMKFAHEWNIIFLESEELHIDITWEMDVYSIHKQVRYEFFLLTAEEMQEKHEKGLKSEVVFSW